MTTTQLRMMRQLEGRRVSLALRDGSRIDDSDLVSVPATTSGTVWLFTVGEDRFVPAGEVLDVWEAQRAA